jgi:hypothetical protein
MDLVSIRFEEEQFLSETGAPYITHLLKGQCHEIVVKMSPWSSILGLN